jgi:prepilin-type N-terminal cleavage/methylation domain-containing protein
VEGQARTRRSTRGFTLIELLVVVVIIGILAATAIPNFIALMSRAREAEVRENMHLLQTAVEDFAVLSTGRYPDSGTDVSDDGRTVRDLCTSGVYPKNPYTKSPSNVVWDVDPNPANPGELGLNPATATGYVIKAAGGTGSLIPVTLSTGGA